MVRIAGVVSELPQRDIGRIEVRRVDARLQRIHLAAYGLNHSRWSLLMKIILRLFRQPVWPREQARTEVPQDSHDRVIRLGLVDYLEQMASTRETANQVHQTRQ
jgi:hypothetical protein